MYTAKNITSRLDSQTPREVLEVGGRRLYPEREMKFREFTSDILKEMMKGRIRVARDSGAQVTLDDLKEDHEIVERTRTKVVPTGSGGTRRIEQTIYDLVEKEEEDDQEADETEEVEQSNGEAEENDQEPEQDETTDEEENEPEQEELTEDEVVELFVDTLIDEGAIGEDDTLSTVDIGEIESSSDLKATSMAEIAENYDVPETFVEDETRSTVTDHLE